MAEAHQATHFGSSNIHDHTEENHDKEVLKLLWNSGCRSWKKKSGKFKNSVKNLIYPAHIESLWIITGMVLAVHFGGNDVPFNVSNRILHCLPRWV